MRKIACLVVALILSGCGSEPSHEDRGLSQWAKDLKAPGGADRKRAAYALGEIAKREPATVPAVLGPLGGALKDSDPEVRKAAALALGKQGPAAKPATKQITDAMKDNDKEVRSIAVQALADIDADNPEHLGIISKLLDDKELDVKMAAVAALGSMGPTAKPAVPALQESLKNEKDFTFKRMVSEAIANINLSK
jgi:vesicle coat complex subunit